MRLAPIALALAVAASAARAQSPLDAVGARIQSSQEAAERHQGPLDGGWTLVTAAGQPVFAFEIVDKVGGEEPLEGAWRDLRRPVTPGDIGFIDDISRSPQGLVITLAATPRSPAATIVLRGGADGVWTGRMQEAGATTRVSLRRN